MLALPEGPALIAPPCLQREMTGQIAEAPLAYLHIDCDLYAGSKDAFTLLSHKIVPGTVIRLAVTMQLPLHVLGGRDRPPVLQIILFDELGNYKNYRDHEIKAFHEWLHVSGAKVATIGMKVRLQSTGRCGLAGLSPVTHGAARRAPCRTPPSPLTRTST